MDITNSPNNNKNFVNTTLPKDESFYKNISNRTITETHEDNNIINNFDENLKQKNENFSKNEFDINIENKMEQDSKIDHISNENDNKENLIITKIQNENIQSTSNYDCLECPVSTNDYNYDQINLHKFKNNSNFLKKEPINYKDQPLNFIKEACEKTKK